MCEGEKAWEESARESALETLESKVTQVDRKSPITMLLEEDCRSVGESLSFLAEMGLYI